MILTMSNMSTHLENQDTKCGRFSWIWTLIGFTRGKLKTTSEKKADVIPIESTMKGRERDGDKAERERGGTRVTSKR